MRDILVAGVIASAGRVDSRVKLQKMTYLLQHVGFELEFYDFTLRDFGPFSAELAATIDSLSNGIVKEEGQDLGIDRAGDRVTRYTYSVGSPSLQSIVCKAVDTRFGDRAEELRQLSRDLAKKDRGVLEVAATAVYIRDEMGVRDESPLWEEVRRRKGHLSRYFDDAQILLRELELAA